jgi:hypothetical protein
MPEIVMIRYHDVTMKIVQAREKDQNLMDLATRKGDGGRDWRFVRAGVGLEYIYGDH